MDTRGTHRDNPYCSLTAKGATRCSLSDTHVSNAADGRVTVEFRGEGREVVSVTMAGGDGGLDGDHAVLRAREMIVQLTAFDDVGQTQGVVPPSGRMTQGNHSDAEPIPSATPGSLMRAD